MDKVIKQISLFNKQSYDFKNTNIILQIILYIYSINMIFT